MTPRASARGLRVASALRSAAFCTVLGSLACSRTHEPEAATRSSPVPAVPAPTVPAPPVPAPAVPAPAVPAPAVPTPALPPDSSAPLWSVTQLRARRGLAAETSVRLRGHVLTRRQCAVCPPNVQCKPCWESFNLGERADSPLGQSVAVELIRGNQTPEVPNVQVFQIGERYTVSGTLRHWAEPSELPFAYIAYTGHAPAP